MKRTFKAKLSTDSIRNLINDLKGYKHGLIDKQEVFINRLTEIGIPIIDERMFTAGDSDPTHYTHIEIQSFQGYMRARLVVEGEDLLFIEFGAGAHYNGAPGTSPHPLGAEMGYTIGSYGYGQGAKDYWYYVDDSGVARRSYGTRASQPVYQAGLEMRRQMVKIAKEVFGA